jgi:hypothetical protein
MDDVAILERRLLDVEERTIVLHSHDGAE